MVRQTAIHFETSGHGFPLILGYPLTASEIPENPGRGARQGYLERLTDRYRVLTMDYPNLGKSERIPANELTVERVCADLLDVASAAGFDEFVWWGYSWGGVIGLQLASRTDRLKALVCGGWPPIGNLYPKVLQSCRATVDTLEYQRQYVTFYESIQHWPITRLRVTQFADGLTALIHCFNPLRQAAFSGVFQDSAATQKKYAIKWNGSQSILFT